MQEKLFRLAACLICLILLAVTMPLTSASADQLQNRSLQLKSTAASANTTHTVNFQLVSPTPVGSLVFEYCTSPLLVISCVAPAGLNANGAVLSGQTGEVGFSIFSTSANQIILTRTASVPGAQANSYTFTNVVNPSSTGSFYLRISSYNSNDGSGPAIDNGSVVGDINQAITINTEVPPILNFCTGLTIPTDCSSADGNVLELGSFSTIHPVFGTSQLLVGTNAGFGYSVRMLGNTMTSGNNTLNPLTSPTTSSPGNSQFGVNLRTNSSPAVGQDPFGGGSATANYNNPNHFSFNNGDTVAGNSGTTDGDRYTVSYLVNISNSQPVGVYATTLTYVVTATF